MTYTHKDKKEIPSVSSNGGTASPTESLETTFPDGGTRAWMVALGSACVLFSTFGYVNAFGVYQDYYITHQLSSYTASAISWIGSIQTFLLMAAGIIGGPLFDRYGSKVIWGPAFLVVLSVMMTSLCKEYYQFFLAQGVLGGIGMGMSMAPALSSTAQYFRRRRAAALGVTVAGSSLGSVIFPIALEHMFNSPSIGFPWGVRIIGFIQLCVLGFAVLGIRARLPPRKRQFFKWEAFKELNYVATVTSIFFLDIGLFIPFFYLPLYASRHGTSTRMASYMVAILNGSSFFGRLIPGIIADRVGVMNMLSFITIIAGTLTLCWIRMTTSAAIIVFAVLYGLFSGGIISLTAAAIANCAASPQDVGTYIGMGMGVVSIATLIGPPINGALVSASGGFLQLQLFSGIIMLFGGMLVMGAKLLGGKSFLAKG